MHPAEVPPARHRMQAVLIRLLVLLVALQGSAHAAQLVIEGPVGSGEFGHSVTTLPNGNIVVTDPGFDAPGPVTDAGAVYMYRPDGTLISTLLGGTPNSRIGIAGVVVLANGNFVVESPLWRSRAGFDVGAVTFGSSVNGINGVVSRTNSLVGSTTQDLVGHVIALSGGNYVLMSIRWDNGAVVDAGAVTFGSGTSGVSGVISPANSLVGSSTDDLSFSSVTELPNGNFVLLSPLWNNGTTVDVGAVTTVSGQTGMSGAISPVNSLVGSTEGDSLGVGFASAFPNLTVLSNGNFVVGSPVWDNGAIIDAGAVTLVSGISGTSGTVSTSNSLVGSSPYDRVGFTAATALTNGNYVVVSRDWDNGGVADVGAVTHVSGSSGLIGAVSPANSLIGTSAGDAVGAFGVTALTNGSYVVPSPLWNNGTIVDAGAATFGSGIDGVIGVVSAKNSLVGTRPGENIGNYGITALANGNYVVASPQWAGAVGISAGAATFGSGITGVSGAISAANSLVGGAPDDQVGESVVALPGGNYLVVSRFWANGATFRAGAVSFGSGASGLSGPISPQNSLVGGTTNDAVGSGVVTILANGDYVVSSPEWDSESAVNVGAATFGSGNSGAVGVVSVANSLTGSTSWDQIGSGGVRPLATGDYVVISPGWDNGLTRDAGAVTLVSATKGTGGEVTPVNSLIGSTLLDEVGIGGVTALPNGNYVVWSPEWVNGPLQALGAVTLSLSDGSVTGLISETHSVLGLVEYQGESHVFSYDSQRNQLAVGQPASNRVVLHRTGVSTATNITGDTPDPSTSGQPVTFTAIVSSSPNAPTDGQVTFSGSDGESCVDTTPTATSATTAEFSCTFVINAGGTSTVIAEYTGSIIHAYSGSGPEQHTTIDDLFGDGFESKGNPGQP